MIYEHTSMHQLGTLSNAEKLFKCSEIVASEAMFEP